MYLIGVTIIISLNGCEDSNVDESSIKFSIRNLTTENYPKVDGSTSTEPLEIILACKLLDVKYSWVYESFFYTYPFRLMPSCDIKPQIGKYITERIHHTGTHSAFENLINKYVDLILVARSLSEDELYLADSLNVILIETPVALDAFVFLVNPHNPINSLTTKSIQEIYTGNITQWNEVGGGNTKIMPFQRNPNSGSQELMESLVMKDLTMINSPDMISYGMMGLINRIEYETDGLGYSVYYYTQFMIRSDSVKIIAVDGVYPDFKALKEKNYPYTTDVYAVIRNDLDTSSMAYKLYEMLSTPSGQSIINESGYIPYY